MFGYVCGLTDEEYNEWVDEPSCLKDVRIFGKKIDEQLSGPWVWLCGVVYGLCGLVGTLWHSLTLFWEIVVCTLSVLALLGFLRCSKLGFINLPKPVHFLVIGLCQKYKYSCWQPGLFPSLLVTLVSVVLGYPLLVFVISLYNLATNKRWGEIREWVGALNLKYITTLIG